MHGLVSVVSLNWSNMHILNRLYHVYTYIHIYLLEKQYIPQSFNISKNKMMYKNMFSKQKILIACFSIIIKIREVFFYNKTTALANESIRTFKQKRLVCTCTVFFSLSFEGWEIFKSQWCIWIMGYSAQVMGGGICLYFLCTLNAIFFKFYYLFC